MDNDIIRHPKYPDLPQVAAVKIIAGFKVHLTFADGVEKEVDLEPMLWGSVFEPVRNDPEMFRRIFIDHGAIAWPNGADIDTDTLYYDGPPPWAADEPEATPSGSKESNTADKI